ncbi:MAG: ABC transporter substrate-binding protein, partial [Chloroflexota bacterium]
MSGRQRVRRATAAAVVVSLLFAACGTPAPTSSPTPSAGRTPPPAGGVLRVGTDLADWDFFDEGMGVDLLWDPQVTFRFSAFEVFRCCLLRSLMSYNGRASSQGGAELRPDIASGYPEVASDGLTWTFRLTEGLMYAPPLQNTEIVASDFVRAIERALRPNPLSPPDDVTSFGPYANFLSELIVGAEDYTFNGASRISGLETPDEHTLVIHLIRPAGDLGARLAMPAFSPLPAGVADGHDTGYGPYLVASGPYMVEGAEQLNPSLPADRQPTAPGYVPGERLSLVRNPSWLA